MLKKTVKYIDFDGNPREDDLYFNLTEAEGVRFDLRYNGLERYINQLVAQEDPKSIMDLLEVLLQESYGEKSDDGRHFVKSPAKAELFKNSAAYSAIIVEFMQNTDEAAAFFSAVVGRTAPQAEVPDTDKPAT